MTAMTDDINMKSAVSSHYNAIRQALIIWLIVPLAVINQLQDPVFDWLVPGMFREKITFLLRALPKAIRKQLKAEGISPVMISVEYIHAPYYRLEQ